MTTKLNRRAVVGGMVAAAAVPIAANAQQHFPAKVVRVVIEFPPGSGPDIVGRLVAMRLSQVLGATFIVEGRPGAGGRIAAQVVATAAPDGSNLLLMTAAQTVIAATARDVPYDLLKDFQFVSMLVEYPFFIFVSAHSKYVTFNDLLDAARKNPDKLTYSTAGIGSTMHLAMELMLQQAGVKMVHVPFAGAQGLQSITQVQSQELDCGIVSLGAISELVRTGHLRALAVTSTNRDPLAPTVPTVSESGVPNYAVSTWIALAAPAKTPPDMIGRLQEAIQTIMREPEIRERVSLLGFSPATNGSDEMRARAAADISKWRPFSSLLQR